MQESRLCSQPGILARAYSLPVTTLHWIHTWTFDFNLISKKQNDEEGFFEMPKYVPQ